MRVPTGQQRTTESEDGRSQKKRYSQINYMIVECGLYIGDKAGQYVKHGELVHDNTARKRLLPHIEEAFRVSPA
jgi:hypothetical protein